MTTTATPSSRVRIAGVARLGPILVAPIGLARGVTRDGIRAVRIGMTREEVEALLGPPIIERPVAIWGTGRHADHSRPMPSARWYPMLWVHLLEGRVGSVYAKRYVWWGMDDIGVYGRDPERHWEGKLFEATFRR